jgi:hypothetical protein
MIIVFSSIEILFPEDPSLAGFQDKRIISLPFPELSAQGTAKRTFFQRCIGPNPQPEGGQLDGVVEFQVRDIDLRSEGR